MAEASSKNNVSIRLLLSTPTQQQSSGHHEEDKQYDRQAFNLQLSGTTLA
jgi:hypothetical protein